MVAKHSLAKRQGVVDIGNPRSGQKVNKQNPKYKAQKQGIQGQKQGIRLDKQTIIEKLV